MKAGMMPGLHYTNGYTNTPLQSFVHHVCRLVSHPRQNVRVGIQGDGYCCVSEELLDFVYYLLKWLDPRRLVETTVKSGLNRDRLYEQAVPLPPLPVQERIVQILHRASQLRRKRLEALNLADAILPAIFHDLFGDPASSDTLDCMSEGIASVRNGLSRRRKDIANEGIIVLRIQDVDDSRIDFDDVNRIGLKDNEQSKFLLKEGDLLLVRVNGNKDLVGRNALFTGFYEPVAFKDHLMRIRFDEDKLSSEYVSAFLRTPFGRHELRSKVTTSAGNHTINQDSVGSIRIPYPSIRSQSIFVFSRARYFQDSRNGLVFGMSGTEGLFAALLSKAFSGDLTAEWETTNAAHLTPVGPAENDNPPSLFS
jgi:restriction endonuclease S subunit